MLSVSVSACNNKNEVQKEQKPSSALSHEDSPLSELLASFDGGYSDGMFRDYSGSFSEMETDHSVQIIRGVVKSVESASKEALAQKAVVEVECVYKGRELKTLNLFPLYDNPVIVGAEYLLFLGSQHPDNPDSLDFYTVGGNQGALEIDRQSKRIVLNSSHIAGNDLKQWLNANLSAKEDDFAQIADYEIVLRSELNND